MTRNNLNLVERKSQEAKEATAAKRQVVRLPACKFKLIIFQFN